MSEPTLLFSLAASCACGAALSYVTLRLRLGKFEAIGQQIVHKAELDGQKVEQETHAKLSEREKNLENQHRNRTEKSERKLQKQTEKLQAREEALSNQLAQASDQLQEIATREKSLEEKEALINSQQSEASEQIETIAGLTRQEARELVFEHTQKELNQDTASLVRKAQDAAKLQIQEKARTLIISAVNRLALPVGTESTTLTVQLPAEEFKGRLIGREGRNVRSFERATGVNLVIDETPSAVIISGFDPLRKEIARKALLELVQDGRIHPTRIEEVVDRCAEVVDQQIRKAGEEAAFEVEAYDLHPTLLYHLGKMSVQHSYGQNLLKHSIEVAHLLGMMCTELGLNSRLGKRIGLLHDIGKTLTHEREGTHALIGRDLALECGESEEVANGIGCHHEEIPPITEEGALCGAADALSAARPGARTEALETYTKRLQKLEEICSEFPGVERVQAMQAGREVRLLVRPEMIDDVGATHLAKDVARRVQEELKYPGRIKITVIREKRAVEYAV